MVSGRCQYTMNRSDCFCCSKLINNSNIHLIDLICSDGQKVVRYDGKEEEDVLATPLKKKRALPPMPPNLAAAQQQLMNKTPHSMKKKKKKEEDDDDFFELLPPGSSMVDPGGHLEGSADDEKRIYYRDPVPEPPKK